MKNLIIIFISLVLAISGVQAQNSFQQFVADVNEATGISSNDFQSNLNKIQKLGLKPTTLWLLYQSGYKVKKEVKNEESSSTIIKREMKINTLIKRVEIQKTEIDSLKGIVKLLEEENLSLYKLVDRTEEKLHKANETITELLKQKDKLQHGDVLVADRKYKQIKCIRTGRTLSDKQFDELYDGGLIKLLKNRIWVCDLENPVSRE